MKSLTNIAFIISFLVIPTPYFSWPQVAALLIATAGYNYRRFLTYKQASINASSNERLTKIEKEVNSLNTAITFRRD